MIGLIDGPVAAGAAGLTGEQIRKVGAGTESSACVRTESAACVHGTFVAGILSGQRGESGAAICPKCPLLVRPIFSEGAAGRDGMPRATPAELAAAMVECMEGGARILNLSVGLAPGSTKGIAALEEALQEAVRRDVVVAAAAGNQSALGSSAVTGHPWVIPVVACNAAGRPLNESNLGRSIGRRGLRAPGEGIVSTGSGGGSITLGGTSVAVPFVTGTAALLWSEFPEATATEVRMALTQSGGGRRASVVPPLLDAEAAYQALWTRREAKVRRQPV